MVHGTILNFLKAKGTQEQSPTNYGDWHNYIIRQHNQNGMVELM